MAPHFGKSLLYALEKLLQDGMALEPLLFRLGRSLLIQELQHKGVWSHLVEIPPNRHLQWTVKQGEGCIGWSPILVAAVGNDIHPSHAMA